MVPFYGIRNSMVLCYWTTGCQCEYKNRTREAKGPRKFLSFMNKKYDYNCRTTRANNFRLPDEQPNSKGTAL
jgi:hypothetical protein